VFRAEAGSSDVLVVSDRMLSLDEIEIFSREAKRAGSSKIRYSCPPEYFAKPNVVATVPEVMRGNKVYGLNTVRELPATPMKKIIPSIDTKREPAMKASVATVSTQTLEHRVEETPQSIRSIILARLESAASFFNEIIPKAKTSEREAEFLERAKKYNLPSESYADLAVFAGKDVTLRARQSYEARNPKKMTSMKQLEREVAQSEAGVRAINALSLDKKTVERARSPLLKKKESAEKKLTVLRKELDTAITGAKALVADITDYEKGRTLLVESTAQKSTGGEMPIYIAMRSGQVALHLPFAPEHAQDIIDGSTNGSKADRKVSIKNGMTVITYSLAEASYTDARKMSERIAMNVKVSAAASAARIATIDPAIYIDDLCAPEKECKTREAGQVRERKKYSIERSIVESAIAKNPGLLAGQLYKIVQDIDPKVFKYVLDGFKKDGAVRTEGRSRGLRYYLAASQ